MSSELYKVIMVSETINQQRSISSVYMALAEEMGEVTKCLTKPDKVDEHIAGELSDLIIAAIDLLYVYNRDVAGNSPKDAAQLTASQLGKQIPLKTEKWVTKYGSQ